MEQSIVGNDTMKTSLSPLSLSLSLPSTSPLHFRVVSPLSGFLQCWGEMELGPKPPFIYTESQQASELSDVFCPSSLPLCFRTMDSAACTQQTALSIVLEQHTYIMQIHLLLWYFFRAENLFGSPFGDFKSWNSLADLVFSQCFCSCPHFSFLIE